MPSCVFRYCSNNSSNTAKCKGITFHRFPRPGRKDREKWIQVVQYNRSEETWLPSDHSCVCSWHFREEDKYTTQTGRCFLKKSAVPCIDLNAPQQQQSLVSQPGPSAGCSRSLARARDDLEEQNDSTDSNVSYITEFQDPLNTEPVITHPQDPQASLTGVNSDQCRFCSKITKDCIDATNKPYLEKNKTALALNNLSVELDFNDDTHIAVCLDCDRKLQEIFDFVKLVRDAQDSLNKVDEVMIDETETLVVKIECESPTPDDNKEIEDTKEGIEDTKEGILDSLTIGETVFVKQNVIINKRKCDKPYAPKRKKPKVVKDTNEVVPENSELIIDIKEEVTEMDDDAHNVHKTAYSEVSDTGTDDKPSELDIATHALLNELARDETLG